MLDAVTAHRIRLIGLDIDGVMTDGGLYIGARDTEPFELKRFHVHDSVGIKLLMLAGLQLVIVSGRVSAATAVRARELGIVDVVQEPSAHKWPPFARLLEKYDLRSEEAAFMGDDLADIPVLRRVGLPVAVQDAVAEVKSVVRFTTHAAGGQGAVREFAETLFRARGQWDEVVRGYLSERSDLALEVARAD